MHVLMRNAALNSARSLVLDQQVTLLVTVVLTAMGIRRDRSIGLHPITPACLQQVEVLKSGCHEIQPHPRTGPNACAGLKPGNGCCLLNFMSYIEYLDSSYIH